MIRFAARQFRSQALVAAVGLAAVAVAVLLTGPRLFHLYDTTVATCTGESCGVAASVFVRNDRLLQGILDMLVRILPALIGIFWGAPLVARELETGTFRLVWTQSVTRTRWLVVKVALVALAAIAVAGLLSLLATWWFTPFDRVSPNRFDPSLFATRGIVPVGYAAFAVALGTAIGLLVRRTVAAMAITLAAFIGMLLIVTIWVRPHFLPPVRNTESVISARSFGFTPSASGDGVDFLVESGFVPNAWVLSSHVVDSAGRPITAQFMRTACPQIKPPPPDTRVTRAPADKNAFLDCVRTISQTYHIEMTYQPAGRYWIFQSMETGLFVLLALGLGAFSVWWVRRRIA